MEMTVDSYCRLDVEDFMLEEMWVVWLYKKRICNEWYTCENLLFAAGLG